MVSWPCALKLNGDDELIYLDSNREFITECSELILNDEDYVVDSVGHRYVIEQSATQVELIKTDSALLASEVVILIRAHEFVKASVCLTKIHFDTVSDAIKSLSF